MWGVVFAVTERDLERLDRFEGVGSKSYRRESIEVTDSTGHSHRVWTYIANPQGKHFLPSKNYIDLYIRGAEYFGLPATYVEELRNIKTRKSEPQMHG